ncbi:MAG: phosphotransferase [Gammaproteobacteria bacterium]|nr:phosphotransferase [Gammaproteobacteria bacterium]
MAEPATRAALDAWGIDAHALERLGGGAVNEHWLVETAAGPLVLRRYHPAHAAEATPYEHDVLRYLDGNGWPVAAPIATPTGVTTVETDAGRWSLFPFLQGTPPADSPRSLQRLGALLALLHADLATWPGGAEQRATFGRVTDLDRYLETRGRTSFDELVERLGRDEPARAAELRGIRERNAFSLHHLGYDALPNTVVHYECLGRNVLFQDDEVTGILDFDFVHRDARVADIARSLAVECGTDPGRVQRWLGGYAAHADPPLAQGEIDVLASLMIASELWNAVIPLALADGPSGAEWMRASAYASIDERLPALELAQPALRRAASVRVVPPGHRA